MKSIDVDAANALLSQENVTLIDVREKDEYQQANISGAILMPLSTFDPYHLPQGGKIIVHCKRGGRSQSAIMKISNYENLEIYNLTGGIDAWINAGYPVNKEND
jgi:rhodanese-related sulfurtransferase